MDVELVKFYLCCSMLSLFSCFRTRLELLKNVSKAGSLQISILLLLWERSLFISRGVIFFDVRSLMLYDKGCYETNRVLKLNIYMFDKYQRAVRNSLFVFMLLFAFC